MNIDIVKPHEIEKKSFEIITEILGNKKLNPEHESVIKRVIHTTTDFDYADTLYFSNQVIPIIKDAIKNGASIITDTNMAKAGINEKQIKKFGGEVYCFMSDEDVAKQARERELTRAMVSMEKAMELNKKLIFVIGNAPTALIRLCQLYEEKSIQPVAVIGVPVGFVNVVESKEILMSTDIPCIVSKGRKGGSNVAAAICNAISYSVHL